MEALQDVKRQNKRMNSTTGRDVWCQKPKEQAEILKGEKKWGRGVESDRQEQETQEGKKGNKAKVGCEQGT